MAPTPKGNEKRRHPRLARRIPCELYISGARHPGIVVDEEHRSLDDDRLDERRLREERDRPLACRTDPVAARRDESGR